MASSSTDKHSLAELEDDISFFSNINSQVVSTPQVNGPLGRKFHRTPSDGLSLSMLVSPSDHHNVTYSNLNTEEKKVFLPSEHCKSVNISRCDSSFDRSFEPKPKVNIQDRSPLLFETEQNKTSTKEELLNDSSNIAQVGQSNKTRAESKARSITFVNETPEYRRSGDCKEKIQQVENQSNEKEFSKQITERKTCKVLFDSSDCSFNLNNEIDSPINITTVTPSYEKLKSSLNNSKKSNNETKIDNLSISYLDELIDLKSEDKSLIVQPEVRTPTRNNISNVQVIPRMLNFVSANNGTEQERPTSPNLDDTVQNENEAESGKEKHFPNMKFVDILDDNLKDDLSREEKCFDSIGHNFIYPNELCIRKKPSLNDKIRQISVNKESILELETMKEMSDVNEPHEDNRHKNEIPTNVKGHLVTFSEMLQSSQTSELGQEQNEKQINQNSNNITNTQLDFIFEKIERDHQNECLKINKPNPDGNKEISNGAEQICVDTNKEVEHNVANTNVEQNISSNDPDMCTSDLGNVISSRKQNTKISGKEEITVHIPCSISNDIETSKTHMHVDNIFVTETLSIEETKIDGLNTNNEEQGIETVSMAFKNYPSNMKSECNIGTGFKSASGKTIDINPFALMKSKQMFAEIDKDIKDNSRDGFKLPLNPDDSKTNMCIINQSISWSLNEKKNSISKDLKDSQVIKTNIYKCHNSPQSKNNDEITCPVESREPKSEVKMPPVDEKTKPPSVAIDNPPWDGFEDNFVVPQTQHILLHRQRKYKDVTETLIESDATKDKCNIPKQTSTDISDSQFHQLGEFVEKQHELSTNDQIMISGSHTTSPFKQNNKDLLKTALDHDLEEILLKPNTSTRNSTSFRKTRPTSPDLSTKDEPPSSATNSSSSKLVSGKLNVSIKPIRSSRCRSPDLSSTENEGNTWGLESLHVIPIPLDEEVSKTVAYKYNLPLASVENVKTRKKVPGSPNPRQNSSDKQESKPTDSYSTKPSSVRRFLRSSSPDLTMKKSMKMNPSKSTAIKLKIENEGICKNQIIKNAKRLEVGNGFQGFSRDLLLLSTRKFASLSLQNDEDNFYGFPKKSTLKITSCVKKDFILNHFLKVKLNQHDMSERAHSVFEDSLNLIEIKGDVDRLPLKSNEVCSSGSSTSHTLPNHGGFKAASGKEINITKESLEKARNILDTIDDGLEMPQKPIIRCKNNDAANEVLREEKEETAIYLHKSRSALTNRKRTLLSGNQIGYDKYGCGKDFLGTTDPLVPTNQINALEIDKKINEENIFETELAVDESAASLQKTKQLLDRFLFDDNPVNIQSDESKSGIASGSDEKKVLPEDSLQKAKQLLDRIDAEEKPLDQVNVDKNSVNLLPFKSAVGGFTSASGKKITVSEESLSKAKELLDRADVEEKVGTHDKTNNNRPSNQTALAVQPLNSTLGGFLSASGKKIVVSQENLQKAKQLLDQVDIDDNLINFHPPKDTSKQPLQSAVGFASASGKKIVISKESLLKAKQLLNDADIDEKLANILPLKALAEQPVKSAAGGFATASGKKIVVSEESRKKAKELLNNVDEILEVDVHDNVFNIKPPEPALGGFASASGKKIVVSEESLQKAKTY
ncbi:hypothetical protein WDU94_000743 [Cyamophila willieti]